MSDTLKAEIRESLSPQAVALMHAHLMTVSGRMPPGREVAWFRDLLADIVGGPDALNELYEEVGV